MKHFGKLQVHVTFIWKVWKNKAKVVTLTLLWRFEVQICLLDNGVHAIVVIVMQHWISD